MSRRRMPLTDRYFGGVEKEAERTTVERAGILLAIVVALCWGSADTVATFAARRQGTFATTFISPGAPGGVSTVRGAARARRAFLTVDQAGLACLQ